MNRWHEIGKNHADLIEGARANLLYWNERANVAAYGKLTNAYSALTALMEWQRDYKRGRATFESWDAALEAANAAIDHLRAICNPTEQPQPRTFESEVAYQIFLAGLRSDLAQSLIRMQARFQPGLTDFQRAARAGRIATNTSDDDVLKWAGCL